ncbi:sulfur carrier protein ThiS [Rosenbergiella epipactidis]|uniref:sulfur carrier protein ThiS n=1 Tax=Rosenbergiella epipactidis TaxID=1544694 RepID=UPI001F4D7064|nr:sulfur carrier protein ThiS [Rosenbergiella epipactidis]MCL9669040.1 sulfur carrier protein ThiS [Rosenbergiella epipactidis]
MQILLNGQPVETEATELAGLLREQQIDMTVVACAVNGQFIAKSGYTSLELQEGMRVEALSPMQGG